jgi:hypothetical protein
MTARDGGPPRQQVRIMPVEVSEQGLGHRGVLRSEVAAAV